MNLTKFSLDYLRPSGVLQAPSTDGWSQAVRFYASPVLKTLQDEGRKQVADLFESIKVKTNAPDLQIEQFVELIHRMADVGQVSVSKDGDLPEQATVALPVRNADAAR